MKVKLSLLILLISICFGLLSSIFLSKQKFDIARDIKFEVSNDLRDGFNYGENERGIVLFNDELKYLTWIIFRGDSYLNLTSVSGVANTNLYGYAISVAYLFLGDWRPLFFIGIIFYLYFLRSLHRLLLHLFEGRTARHITSLVSVIPPVIDLSSGFMRDLLILSVVVRVLVYILEKRYFWALIHLLLLFTLRSFYIYLLLPLFYLAYSKNLKRAIFISVFLMVISLPIVFILKFGNGSFLEVAFRYIELLTGLSKILAYNFDSPILSVAAFNFYSGLTFLIMGISINITIISRLKVPRIFVLLLSLSFTLSVFYGYTLGFFVPRTKLIFLLAAILVLAVIHNAKRRKIT